MVTYGPPERRLGPLTSITLPWDVAVYALRQADASGEVVRRAADSPAGCLSLGPFAQHQVQTCSTGSVSRAYRRLTGSRPSSWQHWRVTAVELTSTDRHVLCRLSRRRL